MLFPFSLYQVSTQCIQKLFHANKFRSTKVAQTRQWNCHTPYAERKKIQISVCLNGVCSYNLALWKKIWYQLSNDKYFTDIEEYETRLIVKQKFPLLFNHINTKNINIKNRTHFGSLCNHPEEINFRHFWVYNVAQLTPEIC